MKALNPDSGQNFDGALAVRNSQTAPPTASRRSPLLVIWNRRWMLLFSIAIGAITAACMYLASSPTYIATAHLLLQEDGPASLASVGAQADIKDEAKSSAVLAITLNNPDIKDSKSLEGESRIARLKDGLNVALDRSGDEMSISFEGPDAAEAARIANTVAEAFQQITTEKKKSATDEALASIDRKKRQYEQELAARTREKNQFQREAGLISADVGRSDALVNRINELKLAVMTKHNEVLSSKGSYDATARLSGLSDAQIKTLTDKQQFNGKPILLTTDDAQMRDQLYLAQQKFAELQERYLERHPALIAARENVEYLQAAYIAALYQRWQIARQQEDVLQGAYDEQSKAAVELSIKAVQFAQLDADLKSTQRSLDMLESQKVALGPPPETHSIQVSNIDPAQVPSFPARPIGWVYLVEGLLIGLIVGVGATFVDGRLRSMSEARQATGLSVLAVVPHMPSTLTPATRGRKFQLDPTSDVADAYRAIRSAIYLRARGKTILVTSPSRGEGKSTVASNLAIALAEGGQKVLLIDADMREPVQHRTFATSADTGISSIVAGRAALQRAAQSTPTKGLELLPCGPVPFNAAETINNQAFADMLAEINARYDYVVLDSPPANAVTDARILAAMCDVTLLVVRRSRTSRRAAIDARDGLLGFGANLLGLIVNDGPRHGQQSMDMPAPRRGVDKANDPTPAPATGSASATAGAASAARPGNRLPSAAASMMARPRR